MYERFVILPDGARRRLGVHRFRCAVCGRTVSFLPDFCVPYKHFGADVINAALAAVLLLRLSLRAVAAWDSAWNAASFSRYCVGQWLQHFGRNSHNLWHFGLPRLFGAHSPGVGSQSVLLGHLTAFAAGRAEHAHCSFRAVQCTLSQPFPPLGLFRAQLLRGCFT